MGLALLEHIFEFFFLRLDLRLQVGVRQDIINRDGRDNGLLLVVQRQFALAGFKEFRDFLFRRSGIFGDVHRVFILADRVFFQIFIDFVFRHFDAFDGLFFQTVDDQILLDDFIKVAAAHAVRNHVVIDKIKIALLGEILLSAENRLRLDRFQKFGVRNFVQAQFVSLVEGAHALKRQLQQLRVAVVAAERHACAQDIADIGSAHLLHGLLGLQRFAVHLAERFQAGFTIAAAVHAAAQREHENHTDDDAEHDVRLATVLLKITVEATDDHVRVLIIESIPF